jgi:alkylation response protein AidB-like acyl-CoA dehydrogenase
VLLTEDQEALRDRIRDFARREIAPFAAAWDREHTVPLATVRKMGEFGLMGMCVPEQWGGAGADFVSYILAIEEIAAADGGISNIMSGNNSPCCAALAELGTEEQKRRFLVPIAKGEKLGVIALTEPGAGSDAAAVKTRARRDGDDWVLDGAKQFITSGSTGGVALIIAVSDPAAGKRGLGCFLTELPAKGWTVVRVERKLGQRASDICQIAIEGLRVPAANVLGPPGDGLRIALRYLSRGRIAVAAQSIGMARAAYEAALAFARERVAFGKPIAEHQAIAFKLADMAMEIEVARQLTLAAAEAEAAGARGQAGLDGEALRLRDGRAGVLGRDQDPRRLRLCRGLPGRQDLARRQGDADLRGHQRGAAHRHRPRARDVICSPG